MTDFEVILARIHQVAGTKTQVQLAAVLGIRQSSISDAKRRGSVPSDWVLKVFERFGVNPEWLKTGHGEVYLIPGRAIVSQDSIRQDFPRAMEYNQSVVVPVQAMNACDSTTLDHAVLAHLAIPAPLNCEGLQVFKAGDSAMEPQITRTAFIGVDTRKKNIVAGELYVFAVMDSRLVLRRVYFDQDTNSFLLRAAKEDHPDIKVAVENAKSAVLGRVAWIIQEV